MTEENNQNRKIGIKEVEEVAFTLPAKDISDAEMHWISKAEKSKEDAEKNNDKDEEEK